MGLKTNNYTIEEFGITLPTAYALLSDLKISDNWATASFKVQLDREKAKTLNPIKKVSINFKFVRNENPVETAYNLAKSKITDYEWDEELQAHREIEKEMPFFGWENDLIEDNI